MNHDDDYIDRSDSNGQTRPNYAKSRKTVEQRQGMRRTASGNWEFESAVTPGVWHKLDSKGRETIPKRKKNEVIRQKPALDHEVQYAALNEHYHSTVKAEREKGGRGLKRRASFDLHQTFMDAVADPGNLRLVSHEEHVSFGGSKRTGQFNSTEKRQARSLFEKHLPSVESTPKQQAAFNFARPKSSVPLPSGTTTQSSMTLRPRKKMKLKE